MSFNRKRLPNEELEQIELGLRIENQQATPTDYASMGDHHAARQEWDKAIEHYQKALAAQPSPELHVRIGKVRHNQMQLNLALASYGQALAASPNFPEVHYLRASAFMGLKHYDNAILDFTTAIALKPNDSLAYRFRARCHESKQQYKEAEADYSRAIQLDPAEPEAYLGRARARGYLMQASAALADLREATRLNPALKPQADQIVKLYSEYKQRLDEIAAKKAQEKQAQEMEKQRIDANSDNFNRWMQHAVAQRAQGQVPKAIEAYSNALMLNPRSAEAYFNRGELFLSKGQRTQAENDFTKAVGLDPRYKPKVDALVAGELLKSVGDTLNKLFKRGK